MKWVIILQLILISCTNSAQEYVTRIDYYPQKKDEVSEENYRKAIYILEQTFTAIKKDSFQINYADHINIAGAYSLLLEPKELIFAELNLAQEKNLESTAAVFMLGVKSPNYFSLTQSEYDSLKQKFEMIYEKSKNEDRQFDINQYAVEGNYDKALVELIAAIGESDQKHRIGDKNMELQSQIDKENLLLIDSLYECYQRYLGRSLVGEKFDHVMWLVIQHAELDHQEKYLPIVYEAVKNKELKEGPLKMLIDRIHTKKFGYQIFGSQMNVELAPGETIQRVKESYEID